MPSISMCGDFFMSSRSLKVPGSDSSALQTRYLSIVALGRNEAFLPIEKPAPPRPRRPESSSAVDELVARHRQRLGDHLVATAAAVDLERVEPGLVDVLEQQRLRHDRFAFGSATGRRTRCLPGSTSRPSRIAAITSGTSSRVIGPT